MLKEFIQKLQDSNKIDALNSVEDLRTVATELGYTDEQIDEILTDIGGFPIDDDELENIVGGSFYSNEPNNTYSITQLSSSTRIAMYQAEELHQKLF